MSASPWYPQLVDDAQHLSPQTTRHRPADDSYESCVDDVTVMSQNTMSSEFSWFTDLSAFEEFSHYYETCQQHNQQDAASMLSSVVAAKAKNSSLLKERGRDVKRRQRSGRRNDMKGDNAIKKVNNCRNKDKKGEKTTICDDEDSATTTGDCVYVRAKRGQATDSHSLAERVRRQKISERMKLLQSIVPNCNKIKGKIPMLDSIINYIHSLQDQVKSLMEELAYVDPTFNANYLPVELTATQQTEDSCTTSAGSEFNMITSQDQPYAYPSPWLALLEEREYTI